MKFFVQKVLLGIIPMIFVVIVFSFVLLRFLPGDVADVLAGQSGSASLEGMEEMRQRLGLDQPLLVQLFAYLSKVVTLDLGYSLRFNTPVFQLIMERLPNTLILMVSALSLALVLGVIAGWIMALCRGRLVDRIMQIVVLVLYSTPGFWIGLMAIVLFSVKLDWLPSGGSYTIGAGLTGFSELADRVSHLVLPSISLASFYIAIYAPLMRSSMIEVLHQDYMRTARAKGLPPLVVQFRHAFKNALIPVTTIAGLHVSTLLGGAIVVETVFNWPGMGRLTLEAVMGRDTPVLLGVLLLSAIVVVVVNLLMDLLQMWLDPRIGKR